MCKKHNGFNISDESMKKQAVFAQGQVLFYSVLNEAARQKKKIVLLPHALVFEQKWLL